MLTFNTVYINPREEIANLKLQSVNCRLQILCCLTHHGARWQNRVKSRKTSAGYLSALEKGEIAVKGYRTPSWFRIKGFVDKKQAKTQKERVKAPKSKRAEGREVK